MKKLMALLLAVMLAFVTVGTACSASASPSIGSLYSWKPAFHYEWLTHQPSLDDVKFAAPIIEYFLGEDYTMLDALTLDVNHRAALVEYHSPSFGMSGTYLMMLTNDANTYFMTPVSIARDDMIATIDFTNVQPDTYTVYVLYAGEFDLQ
jgi:hypothetical protein